MYAWKNIFKTTDTEACLKPPAFQSTSLLLIHPSFSQQYITVPSVHQSMLFILLLCTYIYATQNQGSTLSWLWSRCCIFANYQFHAAIYYAILEFVTLSDRSVCVCVCVCELYWCHWQCVVTLGMYKLVLSYHVTSGSTVDKRWSTLLSTV
jgi:hypothetical protein